MPKTGFGDGTGPDGIMESRRKKILPKTGALQYANGANFSSIVADGKGLILSFNVGAERMLGYAALDVVDQSTADGISDPQELIARAMTLCPGLDAPITPGVEVLLFKASRHRGYLRAEIYPKGRQSLSSHCVDDGADRCIRKNHRLFVDRHCAGRHGHESGPGKKVK